MNEQSRESPIPEQSIRQPTGTGAKLLVENLKESREPAWPFRTPEGAGLVPTSRNNDRSEQESLMTAGTFEELDLDLVGWQPDLPPLNRGQPKKQTQKPDFWLGLVIHACSSSTQQTETVFSKRLRPAWAT